ncbi:MAG: HAD-superfamily hydrolase, subfamily variant 3 [Candidatus Saccharibacteria bacterium]|nr:HAD-superfamily hydrolase, subfamily variant 3 [Candidatus Saccharibacteria bacterium]
MIRAIVFDCFGVLCTDGWLPLKREYFGHDQELFDQAGDMNKQVDAGLADYEDFLSSVADMASIKKEEVRTRIEANPPNQELFDLIKTLKAHYKIGILSNAGANWLPDIFTPEQLELFDAVALSYETGVNKPGQAAYQTIAERLGVEPEECLFTDDQPAFCEAAAATGMQAIVFTSVEQFKKDLSAVLA